MPVDYYICPMCGDELRVGSRGCPRCAREQATKQWDRPPQPKKNQKKAAPKRPWESDQAYDGVDLPEEAYHEEDTFDYDEYLKKEFGPPPKFTRENFWRLVALILLIVIALSSIIYSWRCS
jgi:hypothetical protein